MGEPSQSHHYVVYIAFTFRVWAFHTWASLSLFSSCRFLFVGPSTLTTSLLMRSSSWMVVVQSKRLTLVSRINILPSRRPCAIILPSSSMKHPRYVNRTCIPWSTIWPLDARFLVIIGMCSTFMSFPFCPIWLRGTRHTEIDVLG